MPSTPPSAFPADLELTTLLGQRQRFGDYQGRVLLIVNVASHCGFTPQYTGLETLFQLLGAQGLTVLGFPCNQFGSQEPGSSEQIAQFCQLDYPVTFPVFEKLEVNGVNTHPLYTWLKSSAKGLLGTELIKWNFTKFLVDRQGQVVDRFAPSTTPEQLTPHISQLLAQS